jgi:hypothetical protein
MKKLFLGFILILLGCLFLQGQTVLTYEGQTYNSTETPVSYGVNVPRSTPTTFTFRNNSVNYVNLQGYLLQAGDEGVSAYNNNLKGEQIIGNKFNWNGDFSGLGTAMTITHGVFTGCNIDVGIKYNYLSRVPMGIIRKSASNMVNTTGGVSYNIIKTFNVGGVVKGMSNVNWYNNTFYQDRPTYSSTDPTVGTWRGAIDVYTNTDVTPNSVAHGTKIKNNIFYSKYKTLAIDVMDAESLIGFECDYNVYWVEEGDHTPVFNAGGSTKTWAQWQAMGYDAHSVVMNPNFIDFVNFVPTARLNYGTDLGTAFNTGLATNATWTVNSSPATQVQNGTWQVGARVYAPTTTTITIEGQTVNDSNNPVDDNYAAVRINNSTKAQLYYRNNSITSINQHGYMLDAGDESVLSTNNNLDNAVITGNKFTWNGVQTGSVITHGLLTGYNINDVVKYNYLTNVPYGIIFKSGSATSNMTNTSGGASYNIVKNGRFAGRVKGINGTKFYNNTFYGDAGSWYFILITSNADNGTPFPSINTKVKNNIFYTTTKTPSISIQSASLTGFECDYNVYWCEAGDHTPVFLVEGVSKTWTEWKALGYDAHSVVVNPNFNNITDFLPTSRLNYGTDLGTEFNTGLATTATWVVGTTPATQIQNGTWQVGARIYTPAAPAVLPTVTTTAISSIGTTTANSGGNVTSDGGAPVTERGVCWDQSGGPALDNPHTHDGTGTGIFTSNITGLSPNTTYYVRAYATNSVGTGYGERITFVTNPVTPTYYLYLSKSSLTIPAIANSDGKFNIISNTDWTITSSQPWLTVGVELYYKLGTQGYKTNLYSGTAPDIGAFEYMQTTATGHDSAFVTLTAEANTGALRTATVTVSGTGVTSQIVNVTQEGTTVPPYTGPVWYIATNGNDVTGDGSITKPYFTLNKAWTVISPGHTIYMRGGTYSYLQQQKLTNKNGTASDSIELFAYPGEKPIITRGEPYVYPSYPFALVLIGGNYIHVKGLDISGYTQKDAYIWEGMRAYYANNCTFELINLHHNGGGFQLTNSDQCVVLNCDFHHNQDPLTTSAGAYGNADGMGIDGTNPLAVNYVIGCRFWYNTDDGIDTWLGEGYTVIDNCWSFWNGFIPDTWNVGGDGSGFKLGKNDLSAPTTVKVKVRNCISFQNKKWGFLDNGARFNMEIYNNTAYQNAYKGLDSWAGGFNFTTTPEATKYYIKNNIAYNNGNDVDVSDITNINHNTWDLPVTVTDADFANLSTTGVDGARNADGSLPELSFLKLIESSDLRLAGIDVGLPYSGSNPDLGAYQFYVKPTGTVVIKGSTVVSKSATIKLK